MSSQHFDLVVLGGRISAVAAAALAAKRGLRTMLIDQGEPNSSCLDLAGGRVPVGGSVQAFDRVHEELGIKDEIKNRTRPALPGVQVIFGDRRLELSLLRARLVDEFVRELDVETAEVDELLRRVEDSSNAMGVFLAETKEHPPRGFFATRKVESTIKKHEQLAQRVSDSGIFGHVTDDLRDLLLGILPFVTHLDALDAAQTHVGHFARPVARWLRGAVRFDDGRELPEVILEAAQRRAFSQKHGAVESLTPGTRVEFRLAGGETLSADALIDASADLSGLETVPAKKQKKELAMLLQAGRPRGFLHGRRLEVATEVVPPALGPEALLLNGRRDPQRAKIDGLGEDRPMWLSTRREGDRTTLTLLHPVSSVRAHAEGQEQLEEIMQRRLQRLIPFLDEGQQKSTTLARGFHPLYDTTQDELTGVAGVSTRTAYKNVFVAGPAVLPGLGLEGEYRAALQAVDAVAEKIKPR